MSLGIENRWKKNLVRYVSRFNPQNILDIATGTGDLVFYLSKLYPQRIVGIDLSEQMLAIARNKIKKLANDTEIKFIYKTGKTWNATMQLLTWLLVLLALEILKTWKKVFHKCIEY